ncbi:MAG: hypothetical protein ACOY3Y_04535 [Acidobacteriota bacterium]
MVRRLTWSSLVVVVGVCLVLVIRSASASTAQTDCCAVLEKRVALLEKRLANLDSAITVSDGTVVIRGRSVTITGTSVVVKADADLKLKAPSIRQN